MYKINILEYTDIDYHIFTNCIKNNTITIFNNLNYKKNFLVLKSRRRFLNDRQYGFVLMFD